MRLVVACRDCKRQYDATGRALGSRFRCRCGVVVEIASARGHDARVVRCSSCGAPREPGTDACRHCGVGFTLHERDMHTICPACVTRISDKARFCHSCGDAISSAADLGTGTELACPACGGDERLQARSLGTNLSVSECGRCAGLWLDNQTFERAVTRAEEVSTTIHGHAKAERRAEQTLGEPKRGPAYRPCVRCGKLMNRQNYGKRSNVIVDACKEHGVWFDAHELGQILDWVRSGGLEKMREVEEQKLRDERRRRAMEPPSIPMTAPGAPDNDGRPDLLVELLKLFW